MGAVVRKLIAVTLLSAAVVPATADDAAAWAALRGGGVVALMRHTDAPGAGDPPGWRLDDCSTQRNLSEKGRADARTAGGRLKAQRVPIAQVLSSPWCRCTETAKLMDLGPVHVEPTFSNAFVLHEQRDKLTQGARAVIGRWRGPGVLLVITHGANIQALTGRSPAAGEMIVVTNRQDGDTKVLGAVQMPADR